MVHENDVVHRHHAPRTGMSDVGRKFVAKAVEDIHSAQTDGAAHGVTRQSEPESARIPCGVTIPALSGTSNPQQLPSRGVNKV